MSTSPKPFDSDGSTGSKLPIIRRDPDDPDQPELIEAIWGSNTRFTGGVDYRFVRGDPSEQKDFPVDRRCLIPADAIDMKVGHKQFRATLDSGSWFYLAGIWEPGLEGEIYVRVVTVHANSDLIDYQKRHGAIIHRRQVYDWLDGLVPATDLICTPPARTFDVERIGGRKPRRQGQLAL